MVLFRGLQGPFFLFLLLLSFYANAEVPERSAPSYFFSLNGDPSPSILGVGLQVSVLEYLRLSSSVGVVGLSVGLELLHPTWDLTPFFGIHEAYTYAGKVGAFGVYGKLGLQAFTRSGWNFASGWSCPPDLFHENFGACSAYLQVGHAF